MANHCVHKNSQTDGDHGAHNVDLTYSSLSDPARSISTVRRQSPQLVTTARTTRAMQTCRFVLVLAIVSMIVGCGGENRIERVQSCAELAQVWESESAGLVSPNEKLKDLGTRTLDRISVLEERVRAAGGDTQDCDDLHFEVFHERRALTPPTEICDDGAVAPPGECP